MKKRVGLGSLLALALLLTALPTAFAQGNMECIGMFTGTHDGNLVVPEGEFCIIIGADISGHVLVEEGAVGFHSHGSHIGKNVNAKGVLLDVRVLDSVVDGNVDIRNSGNAGTVGAICASEIGGNVHFTNNQGTYFLGATGFGGVCPEGDVIEGHVQIQDNAAHFVVTEETVGRNFLLLNNTGGAELMLNQVGRILNCQNNEPPPTGAGNTAEKKQGQCEAL